MGRMPKQQLVETLDTLRSERDAAAAQVEERKRKLWEAETQLTKLEGAVQALEVLLTPAEEEPAPEVSITVEEGRETVSPFLGAIVAESRREDVPERLAKYVPAGGKRLRSKLMVFDLLQKIGEPVPREKLQHLFFEYYGRTDLERYWIRPETALSTAVDRASKEHLILEIPAENGRPALYTAGFAEGDTGRPAMYSGEED